MRSNARRFAVLFSIAALATPLALPRSAEAIYRYFSRQSLAQDLANEPDKWLDQDITVTDELCFVWAPGNNDKLEGEAQPCVKFDTLYFKCAVANDKKGDYLDAIWETAKKGVKDIVDKIEEVNEKQRKREIGDKEANDQRKTLYWELHERWKQKPIVTIFGKVRRADFWGPVQGKEEGAVRTEAITIVVDKIEKPRDRWYEDLDD